MVKNMFTSYLRQRNRISSLFLCTNHITDNHPIAIVSAMFSRGMRTSVESVTPATSTFVHGRWGRCIRVRAHTVGILRLWQLRGGMCVTGLTTVLNANHQSIHITTQCCVRACMFDPIPRLNAQEIHPFTRLFHYHSNHVLTTKVFFTFFRFHCQRISVNAFLALFSFLREWVMMVWWWRLRCCWWW